MTFCSDGLPEAAGLLPSRDLPGQELSALQGWDAGALDRFAAAWRGEEQRFDTVVRGHCCAAVLSPVVLQGVVTEVIGAFTPQAGDRRALETEAQYRNLLYYSPIPIVLHSDGMLVYANDAALKLVGETNEPEAAGRPLLSYLVDDASYRERARKRLESLDRLQRLDFAEQRIMRGDGAVLDVEVCSTVVSQYGDKPLVQTVILDVTERKRMERAAKEAEKKYRILVEKATFGIYLMQNDRLVYVNPKFAEMFGYIPEEMIGMKPTQLVDPRDVKRLEHNIGLRMRGDVETLQYAYRGLRKDGAPIDIEGGGTMACLNGVPTIIGMLTDVTDRNKTEETLRKSENRAMLGELAAGIAHEIRNPLTPLKGFVQLLRGKSADNRQYFDIMLDEIERINSIVSRFMYLAKPNIGGYRACDARLILEDMIQLLRPEAMLRNVEIVGVAEQSLPLIHCDDTQIKQVFINVMKNAMEAMPKGGTLRIVCRRKKGNRVHIRFQDQGVGMSEERVRRLGEPFYTTKEKGTGLGLMMCYRIIESHGGKIDVSSKLGHGTTVSVMLPGTSGEKEADAVEAAERANNQ